MIERESPHLPLSASPRPFVRELKSTVFIVDDDLSVRESLELLLRSVGLDVKTYPSAEEFLKGVAPGASGCLITDLRMPGMSGLDLQERCAGAEVFLPIIFITGHGSIPHCVRAMKAGAVDFLQKPFDEEELLNAINRAIERDRQAIQERDESGKIQWLVDALSPREYEVFALLVTGMSNKQVAYKLGTSERTIKAHRSRIMEKMHAGSLADLTRYAEKLGIPRADK
jgi:two-component system, LuxR family, response regulator FixJ